MIPEVMIPKSSVETDVSQDDVYKYYSQRGGKLEKDIYDGILAMLYPTEDLPSKKATPRNPSEIAAEAQMEKMLNELSKNGCEIPKEKRGPLVEAYVYARTADKPGSSYDQPRTPMINLFDHDLLKEIFEILRLNSAPEQANEQAHTESTQVFSVPDKSAKAA